MNPKLSLIVPVYNVKPYLRQSLDSVLAQTFTDYELILVDDGSTDGSGDICDEYASHNSKITVVHQKNTGAGVARNVGLAKARGEYISFLDSDDWIDSNTFEAFIDTVNNRNITVALFDYYENKEGEEQTYQSNRPSSLDTETVIIETIQGNIHPGVVFKLFKRQFLIDNGITFPPYSIGEDMYFTISSLLCLKDIVYIPQAFYHYRYNPSSTMNKLEMGHIYKRHRDFIYNMKVLIETQNLTARQRIYKSLVRLINNFKTRMLYDYCEFPDICKGSLELLPESVTFKGIETKKDFFLYFASKYHVYAPFKLMRRKDRLLKRS